LLLSIAPRWRVKVPPRYVERTIKCVKLADETAEVVVDVEGEVGCGVQPERIAEEGAADSRIKPNSPRKKI
jgi:hypothetical protein